MTCIPNCPICEGFGWLHRDLPISDPEFGKLVPCPNKPVGHNPMSGLSESEYDLTWNNIIDRNNVKEAETVIRKTLEDGYGWVFIWGDYGLAKTLLLKIAVAECIRNRKESACARMASIIDDMRLSYDSDNPSYESEKRLNYWANIPLLCIDEFDRVRKTEYSDERRFVLMDRRYEDALREKSITIMAANLDPSKYEGYLYDRIRDGRFDVVKLLGSSARPLMEKK